MVALDTNVVVRFLTGDDQEQLLRVRALLASEAGWVSLTVFLETAGVLQSVYSYKKEAVLRALGLLIRFPAIAVQDLAAARQALEWAHRGMELADALHLAQAGGCEAFVTFDRRLTRLAAAQGQAVRKP